MSGTFTVEILDDGQIKLRVDTPSEGIPAGSDLVVLMGPESAARLAGELTKAAGPAARPSRPREPSPRTS